MMGSGVHSTAQYCKGTKTKCFKNILLVTVTFDSVLEKAVIESEKALLTPPAPPPPVVCTWQNELSERPMRSPASN